MAKRERSVFVSWMLLSFALFPVLFITSCISTMSYLTFYYREDIRGQAPPPTFPIAVVMQSAPEKDAGLIRLKSGRYAAVIHYQDLARFKEQDLHLSLGITPDEAMELSRQLKPLADPEHEGGSVALEAARHGSALHVHYKEAAGEFAAESWYAVSGETLQPQYFRHHGDFGYGIAGIAGGIVFGPPLAALLAALVTWFRRKRKRPAGALGG